MKAKRSDLEMIEETTTESFQKPLSDEEGEPSYWTLLRNNRAFRLYISSYLITHAGEWFTYVASINMIERFLLEDTGESLSRTKISILVVVRIIPNVVFVALGGALADAFDRRISMIWLDVIGAVVVLLYLVAYQLHSIALVYAVAFLQQCVAALYEPCRSAIVQQMVTCEGDLKKATTLSVLAWSLMAAVGASLGGLFVALLGIKLCFVFDSISYVVSAFLVFRIGGKYNAAEGHENNKPQSICRQIQSMTVDGARYIRSSFFGGVVFVKASGAILFGASDVLNVSFSERGGDEEDTSLRLGGIFAASGLGCLLGPMAADCILQDNPPASSLQLACIWGLAVVSVGYVGLGLTEQFMLLCLFSAVRAAGSSLLWIDSSVILQTFSSPKMLGRVMAVEYALATFMEGSSAVLAGQLQDRFEMTAEKVSLVLSVLGAFIVLGWSLYHFCGCGVAGYTTHSVPLAATDEDEIKEAPTNESELEIAPLVTVGEDVVDERIHHREHVLAPVS